MAQLVFFNDGEYDNIVDIGFAQKVRSAQKGEGLHKKSIRRARAARKRGRNE